MSALTPPAHRTIFCVDVEGFGDHRRTDLDQVVVRESLYASLERALDRVGIGWRECYQEDRGDGVLILVPAEIPKRLLVSRLPQELARELARHNRRNGQRARIRVRAVLHAGEIQFDEHGVASSAINSAFRLLEASSLKRALADSRGTLALIASNWFYQEVIRHAPESKPNCYRRVAVSVKETRTTGWICLPDDPYPPREDDSEEPEIGKAVPRQMPAVAQGFVGRTAELEKLNAMIDDALSDQGGLVVISAIDGMAGIGKTALAIRWAHAVAERFPDGQLYVNLRGFDPSGPPMPWREAVRGFLEAFEVPPERIPISPDAQAALYRSLMNGRRMLVVLDNARDADQVRPLLPGSHGCGVLVTSRNRLTSLMVSDGARPLTLDLLTEPEARQLLAHRITQERINLEPESTDALIAQCAGLPLALAIAAAHAATRPQLSLAALVTQLRQAQEGLDGFAAGDPLADVRTVFSCSYRHLSDAAARVFRLLGLHPGHDITASAIASLAGVPLRDANASLSELFRSHLIDEQTPGRFSFHDLLSAYAGELVHTREAEPDRSEAVDRLLGHYLRSSFTAAVLLHPRAGPLNIPTDTPPSVTPQTITDYVSAVSWFETEHSNLLATVQLAADTRRYDYAWQVPWTMEEYLDRRGHRNDCLLLQQIALTAAEQQNTTIGQAHAHSALGRAHHWPRNDTQAQEHYQQALKLFRTLRDQIGQAHAHIDLSHILQHQGKIPEALIHAEQALELTQVSDDKRAHARALYNNGLYLALAGHAERALNPCEQALLLLREVGDLRGEAYALDALGSVHHRLGNNQKACTLHEQASLLFHEFGDRAGQIKAQLNLGDAHYAAGRTQDARAVWQYALDMITEIGDADPGHIYPEQILPRLRSFDDQE